MNIRPKLLLAVTAPCGLILALSWYAADTSEELLLDVAGRASVARADAMLSELEHTILIRLSTWERYAKSSTLRTALEDSNRQFELDGVQADEIDQRDAVWRAHYPDIPSQLRSELECGKLSGELEAFATLWESDNDYLIFPEVFVTNRFGVNVAMTNVTSDYRQDDEDWWQAAFEYGRHITPLGHDESSDVFATAICVRIDSPTGEPLGVLKAVFDTREIFETFRERAGAHGDEVLAIALLDEHDQVIFTTSESLLSDLQSNATLAGTSPLDQRSGQHGSFELLTDAGDGERVLCAFARPRSRFGLPSPGMTLVLGRDEGSVLAPARALQRNLTFFAGLATACGTLFASLGSLSVSRRLARLTSAAGRMGQGELDVYIESDGGGDELDEVITTFNSMSRNLAAQAGELRLRNSALKAEIESRKALECQLVQAEKLHSIGQLAAGIAHEINTPTQYVGDNTLFLEECFRDITPILQSAAELASKAKESPELADLSDALILALEQADVGYLTVEIPNAIKQSLDGIERVRNIVKSMKDFSHPGGEEMTALDLNRAIEGTVMIASNEWKYVAELETDFDEDLAPVICFPGQINQVVLNMIVNAAHAVYDRTEPGGKGLITIATRCREDHAEIRISDTGTGIPEEIRGRIFDPFYTTKEVGKGTGQGLSMAHGVIVNRHGGTISVESEVGVGTTFIVRLPFHRASELLAG